MNFTCTGCHGSRVENEFKGRNEDEAGERFAADVHFNPGGMPCFECHSGEEMHGELGEYEHRYADRPTPSCTAACHTAVSAEDEIDQHTEDHLERLACQVCHSIEYKNCYSCHVSIDDEGVPCRTSEPSVMGFEIGLNPLRSSERPYKYVVLRHVPTCSDECNYYGENLLPNFDAVSTWKYATPHNIQLNTPQNASCDSCHGNADLFLTEEDIRPGEMEANRDVIVPEIPDPYY
jgi:thiosulfate/3-mercaptopyruvate sulfurtransferase